MPGHFTRRKPEISAEERGELERWLRRPKTSQALAYGHGLSWPAKAGPATWPLRRNWKRRAKRWGSGGGGFSSAAVTDCSTKLVRELHDRFAMRTWNECLH